MAAEQDRPSIAIMLSYLGGILILLWGISAISFGSLFMPPVPIPGFNLAGMIMVIGVWGIICGIIIIAGAYMIQTKPAGSYTMWGAIILVFSFLSYFGGGGFFIGGILGIIGGIIAVSWKPEVAAEAPETD